MRRFLPLLVPFLLLVSCAAPGEGGTLPTSEPALPYATATPSLTPTLLPARTNILFPTPTPVLHTVVAGDTLESIAGRFGVTVEALLAANPGVQPAALTVGMQLLIPSGSAQPPQPSPTPVPVEVTQARCWPEAAGGAWCFAVIRNDSSGPVENLSALFSLESGSGEILASQVAYALLDLLPPGASMPLGAHFPPPMEVGVLLRLQVLTANRLLPDDPRYLPVMLENTLVSVAADGRSAQVSGRLMLTVLDGQATTLWVLASAYDPAGNLVGFRRWEAGSPLAGGESLAFDLLLSSMGPAIERVEFLAEARP